MTQYTRREVVEMSIRSFLSVALALPRIAQAAREANAFRGSIREHEGINWDAFLEQVARAASGQFDPAWNQDVYVNEITALATRLRLTDPRLAAMLRQHRSGHHGFPEFRQLEANLTFQVTLISFEQGEAIPHHDHPQMTGVMTCATGELMVQSYDLLGPGPRDGIWLLRQLTHARLRPREISTLTARKGNVHRVEAHTFSQVIDIFTPPYTSARIHNSHWYAVDTKPLGLGGPPIFQATAKRL